MSALGHWRTLQGAYRMSALPPKADMLTTGINARFVPIVEIDDYPLDALSRGSRRSTLRSVRVAGHRVVRGAVREPIGSLRATLTGHVPVRHTATDAIGCSRVHVDNLAAVAVPSGLNPRAWLDPWRCDQHAR